LNPKRKSPNFIFKIFHNPSTIKVFIKISTPHQQSKIKEIIGILKGTGYSSLELQEKSKEWWKDVSD